MLNLNNEAEQKTGGGGCIPDKSIVKVRLEIRTPSQVKYSPLHPLVQQYNPGPGKRVGLVGLNCCLEVIAGQYAGSKIFENIWLPAHIQAPGIDDGQRGSCIDSGAMLRSIFESARGIHPEDPSPAKDNLAIDVFQHIEFCIMVGIKKVKAGDQFVNNKIKRIITLKDEAEYHHVMQGGEIITDIPLPVLPTGPPAGAPGGYTPPGGSAGYTPPGGNTRYTPPTNNGYQAPGTYTPPANQGQSPNQGGGNGYQPPAYQQPPASNTYQQQHPPAGTQGGYQPQGGNAYQPPQAPQGQANGAQPPANGYQPPGGGYQQPHGQAGPGGVEPNWTNQSQQPLTDGIPF